MLGACYHCEKHKVYELVSARGQLTWHVANGELEVIGNSLEAISRVCRMVENFERAKARGGCADLPKLREELKIVPMPTVHTVTSAYNLLYGFYGKAGAQRGASSKVKPASDGVRPPSGVLVVAHMQLARNAKPVTAVQDNLCWDYSVYLERAENERVHPDDFEGWIGKEVLNGWTVAAKKLQMHSETAIDWHYRNYLSDREEAEIQAMMARSALH
ncbi:hypothetical protein [Methylobacterium sp. SyP6R]|uniref:hypothetical protein n=1 Tax=Methylobacterium sp. SyP6R TaxID=2718876 RepID=UPI001F187B62|nr:hypothetical protein [Methylobacterium sp. SyP6R]MCF4124967.1 hypothetical protein [Methylobacterium sp. SyP6R]